MALFDRTFRDSRTYGKPGPLRSLLRMRFSSALVAALPALLFMGWYIFLSWESHLRHQAGVGESHPLTVELLQLHLHDRLTRDLHRFTMPDTSKNSPLPTYHLRVGNGELDELDKNLPPEEGLGSYVPAYLKRDDEIHKVRVRYRGSKHWHWNQPQKSWKVRLKDGEFLDGRDTLNFINTPDPLPFDEQIVMDVARDLALLSPEYHPVRLVLNKTFMGLYYLETQPDEGLLRQNRRMPGSIFSGNGAKVDKKTGVSKLWSNVKFWKKVALAAPEEKDDFHELAALITEVNKADDLEFELFARRNLNLEALATLDALDVVFGVNQRDFDQNHKLFLDPYKGRFEPVAWGFTGWKHQQTMNRAENPLLLRLKGLPGYRVLRNQRVWELMQGPCSPDAVESRGELLFRAIARDQLSDPFWDAYHLLPKIDKYIRQMIRPMNVELQGLVFQSRMAEFSRRHDYLKRRLSRVEVGGELVPSADGTTLVRVRVGGDVPVELLRMVPEWNEQAPRWKLSRDSNLNRTPDPGDEEVTAMLGVDRNDKGLLLVPGVALDSRPPHPSRGRVESRPEVETYDFFLAVTPRPREVEIEARNSLTGERFTRTLTWTEVLPDLTPIDCTASTPAREPGWRDLHPWCFPDLSHTETITLGPGELRIDQLTTFPENSLVRVAPGTRIQMGPDAGLIFLGQVRFNGEPGKEIVVEGAAGPWKGMSIQGRAADGSYLRHTRILGGGGLRWNLMRYPAALNLHDVTGIAIKGLELIGGAETVEGIHMAYAEEASIDDTSVSRVVGDAFDVEFSKLSLSNITVADAGDECLDLMGTDAVLEGARFSDWGGSGISAGEETRLKVRDCTMERGRIGVLAKNNSKVNLSRTRVREAKTGVRVEVRGPRYKGKASVRGEITLEACERDVHTVDGKNKNLVIIKPGQDGGEK